MGRILLAALIACGPACIDWGSLYDAEDGGAADSSATDRSDAPPNSVGCSDGSAETLIADRGLAACAGAWLIPGVVDETGPACDRAAGNDGTRASGEGCAVADLCAAGWHVCRDASDVAVHGGDEVCREIAPPSPDGADSYIFLTRQRGSGDAPSCNPDGTEEAADDAWGCGTLGLETADCKPLDHHLSLDGESGCLDPFACGEDPMAEGRNVTKREPELGGGVLCCSDGAP